MGIARVVVVIVIQHILLGEDRVVLKIGDDGGVFKIFNESKGYFNMIIY